MLEKSVHGLLTRAAGNALLAAALAGVPLAAGGCARLPPEVAAQVAAPGPAEPSHYALKGAPDPPGPRARAAR
ncbi:MAG: hypothetical protein HZA24_02350 [Nitrospirae bacterium]|nr:hypothetical protein [Nitrospirota bacterium]